ncbi:MAG: stage II sporulation protein P [Clostridiales bacterium]|nr:stage II sporulation protein P [Clostridiales bacterium]
MKQPNKLLRRGVALVSAGAAVWLTAQTADLSGAWDTLSSLHAGEGAVTALLEAALGETEDPLEDVGLEGVLRLAVEDTPELAAQGDAVAAWLEEESSAGTADPESEAPPEEAPEADGTDEAEAASSDPKPEESEPEPEPEAAASSSDLEPEEDAAEALAVDWGSVSADAIGVDNNTGGKSVDVSALLSGGMPLKLQSAEAGPQILIMHTHTTEAYAMSGDDVYTETDTSRTTDENYNMVRVGEEMKAVFEACGLSVLHDTTTYDYPSYNGSYGRSLAGIQAYLEEYPTIAVVLDVHRDALIGSDGTAYATTTEVDGEAVAQVMLVVGTNDSGLEHPNWTDNMAVALRLQAAMLSLSPDLARDIDLRSQRFNQHLTTGSVLVEVGTSGNTLQEALAGARLFAQAAATVYLDCVE